MCRAVLRSMYSSGLKVLTSAAILVSKFVVSKRVIRPTPETPSTRLDQTVSRSFPIGVTKPRPVTATRRPLALLICHKTTDAGSKLPLWRVAKNWHTFGHHDQMARQGSPLQELAQVEGQAEALPDRRVVQVAADQVTELLDPVEDRMPVQPQT